MKKIMFNDKYGLTEAVLEGRKTMTRRIVKNPKEIVISGHKYLETEKLRYKVGEVVAIAQNYNEVFDEFATIVYTQDKTVPDNFEAFGSHSDETLPRTMPGWGNKMFVRADLMPHKIRIKNVSVQRLQEISDEDCLREGIEWCHGSQSYYINFDPKTGLRTWLYGDTPREAFAALIDKVSGEGTWQSNPWVFVYQFELVK